MKINSGNPLYLFINKINRCIEESYRNKCLTLVPTYKSKEMMKNKKDCGKKLEILLDQKLITPMIVMKNI